MRTSAEHWVGCVAVDQLLTAQIMARNLLIKRIPWNAGSGASSPCSFTRNAMFSSLLPTRGLMVSPSASMLAGRTFSAGS